MASIPQDSFIIATTISNSGSKIYWTLLERIEVSQSSDDKSFGEPLYDYTFYNGLGVLKIEGQRITVVENG